MFGIGKHKFVRNTIIAIASLGMVAVNFAAAANAARIMPGGKVSIIEGGKVVGEFSNEAPFPEGSLLRCEARCTVKMDDLYMAAEPQTTFSVAPQATANELTVQEGTVYYSLPKASKPMQISTPPGNASIRKFSVTDSQLKGYAQVSGNKAEIGVIDGGTMTIETSSGEMVVTPGKQITIAAADPSPAGAASGGARGGTVTAADIALGIAGTAVIVGGIYALVEVVDWESSSDGSPSSP